MHVVIFGAGGVGGYFGGRLAQAGEDVTFIARGDHLKALQENGLKVESIKGNFYLQPISATDGPSATQDADVVLVCVKMWHILEAAKNILPMCRPGTMVIPMENGVEAPSLLADVLGRDHVLGGMCQIASRIAAPGVIHHTGLEPYIAFGELDNHPSERAGALLQIFHHAGISAEIPADIQVAMWQKFLFISSVSGIGAITRVPFGDFRAAEGTRKLLVEALNECFAVGVAQGIRLPPDSVEKRLAFIDSLPPGTMASMQRDIIAGRPSELEAQNGAIVRMGQKYDVATPVHAMLYHCLLPQEKLARQQSR
jgi:2-dehydropantoate 2-reductase